MRLPSLHDALRFLHAPPPALAQRLAQERLPVQRRLAFEELLARIEALLRRAHVQSPGTQTYQDGLLTLNPLERTCTCRDEPLELTQKEFDLLAYFLARPGQALSRDESCVNDLRELIGSSWSTVSQHLAVLRNAGIVDSTKHGNQVVYRLALPCVSTFTSCLQAAARGRRVEVRTCCN